MNKISIALLIGLVSGCTSVTPNYDARFGDAVREAKKKMIIDPEAGKNPDPVIGLDGKAARETIILYQGTYKTPPRAVNVINIGGNIAGADK